jgi:hypothetical protein
VRGANLTPRQLDEAKLYAASWLALTEATIERAIADNDLR